MGLPPSEFFFCSMDNNQKEKVNILNWNHARGITKFWTILIPKRERRREIKQAWCSELQSCVQDWTKDTAKQIREAKGIVHSMDKQLHRVFTRAYTRQEHLLVAIKKESGELTELIVTYRKELPCRKESGSRIFNLL